MRLYFIIMMASLGLFGCAKRPNPTETVLKVVIQEKDGIVFTNGIQATPELLLKELDAISLKKGSVWIYCDELNDPSPPGRYRVMLLAYERKIPITIFQDRNFSSEMRFSK